MHRILLQYVSRGIVGVVLAALVFVPMYAHAASFIFACKTPKVAADWKGADLSSLFCLAFDILSGLVPVIFGLALLTFIWGVIKFVLRTSDEKERVAGKQFMLYGVIGLFVMFTVWGILNLLVSTFLGG